MDVRNDGGIDGKESTTDRDLVSIEMTPEELLEEQLTMEQFKIEDKVSRTSDYDEGSAPLNVPQAKKEQLQYELKICKREDSGAMPKLRNAMPSKSIKAMMAFKGNKVGIGGIVTIGERKFCPGSSGII